MKNDAALLKAILEYCDKIDSCIAFFGNDEEDFLTNDIFQSSCAFYVLQIGELVKSIPRRQEIATAASAGKE
jgi:uncharacterized protein with HEPN domain